MPIADDVTAVSARLSRLEPLTRLATGGMAEIWLAREHGAAGLERFVVLKRLLPHLARDASVVEMFVSEARFIARLAHPNVVQIHELAQDADGYCLIMEYVAGCTVRELMSASEKGKRELPLEVAVCIIEQACRGAHAAHELADPSGKPLGLVHRDISPHNLMIGPEGDVKLLDFGIAKATALSEATQTRSLKGKCSYMSPEQCSAGRLDRRSDVFSLGVVLWELLTGERLFVRESEFASMQAIVSGEIQLPSEVRSELPVALDAVVARALAKAPDDRWSTADDLRRALVAAAEKHGFRPSRDALAATLTELLGDRLGQRQQALLDAAAAPGDADPTALHLALMGTDPNAMRSGSGTSGRSRTGSDEDATVVQRRSAHPSDAPPPPAAGPHDAHAPEENTVVQPTRVPSRVRPVHYVALLVVALGAVLAVTLWLRSNREAAVRAQPSAEPALTGAPLRFVIAPTVEPDVIRREISPFTHWLGRTLDRPIDVHVAASYEECGNTVARGDAELGMLPPLVFVQTVARTPTVRPVVLRLYEGSRGSDGYLLVRDDKPLATAAELKGQTVCLVDRESTTGYLLPRIWMRKAGLDPDKDIKTILSGDHMAALRDLSTARCDAAAVYSGAYLSASQQGIRVGGMRVLAITGRVPQDVVVASPALPAAEVSRIERALIGFDPERDIQAPRIGAVLGITGFARFEPAEFTIIREAAAKEGLLP